MHAVSVTYGTVRFLGSVAIHIPTVMGITNCSLTCYTEITMLFQITTRKFSKWMGEFQIFSSKHELHMQRTL